MLSLQKCCFLRLATNIWRSYGQEYSVLFFDSEWLAKVKVAGTLSEWFRVKKGVRQGCVLSPYLFNILAEMVMRATLHGFQGGLQIGGRMITNLRYADDIILLATSEAELQELVNRLDRVSRKYSLLINVDNERRHSVPRTHSERTTGAGGYVPVPWVADYRRW